MVTLKLPLRTPADNLVCVTFWESGPHSAVGSESDCRSRVKNSNLARSHTFVETDHEIISTVILLNPLIQELQAKVCAASTG